MWGREEKAEIKLQRLTHCVFGRSISFWVLSKKKKKASYSFYIILCSLVLMKDRSTSAVQTVALLHRRFRDSVPWPGQRWKPRPPWRLPLSNRGRQSPARASGEPHWPSLLHAELLLHLLTLINCHPFPSCSTFHLRDAANGVCPSTCLWDHSPWNRLHLHTSKLLSQAKIITSQT